MYTRNDATRGIAERMAEALRMKWLKTTVLAVAAAATMTCGCSKDDTKDGNGQGELRLVFPEYKASMTRAVLELPDTNDFLLEIKGADGKIAYKGTYGLAPEVLSMPSGGCSISIRSESFSAPAFDRPQFGDDQVVMVPAGGAVCAVMQCRQTNAGIRLKVSPDFLTACPDGILSLRSGKDRIIYNYRETKYAYFLPGDISLVLTEGTKETVLVNKRLEPADMLHLNINVAGPAKSGITVQIDTARLWFSEDFTIGEKEEDKGSSDKDAMSVSQAKESVGIKDVWVTGYIVGGDMTSGAEGISFSPPFEKASHLAIASRGSVTSKASCIAVELTSGDVRESLNLASHPELLGRRVSLKGDIEEKYLGITGLKGVSDFVLY